MAIFDIKLPSRLAKTFRIPANDFTHQQARVLKRLLHKARFTEFGQQFRFDEILMSENPGKQFQELVPLYDYNKIYNDWWHKTLENIPDVCWPGRIKYYALSSGTSEAASKYIPITKDLLRGNKMAMIKHLLTLRHYHGKMILGAVYNPFINEFFFSEKGFGATLNDKIIKVSDKSDLLRSCLVTGFPYSYLDEPNGPLEVFDKLIRHNIPVRRLGSAAIDLCWVAAGRFDGFYEHNLRAWDSAAGFLIVEEAGGKVTDFKGNYYSPYQPNLLATNGKVHDDLLLALNGKWNP